MAYRLAGVALITGAGSGIGRATAQLFSRAGCRHLVLVDRDAKGLSETVKQANLDLSKVTTHALDITEDQAVEDLIQNIPKKFGGLHYALNAAAISGAFGPLGQYSMKDFDEVLNINLRAQVLLCKAEVNAMLATQAQETEIDARKSRASIVNYTSVFGFGASLGVFPAYATGKHAIIGLTRSVAVSYATQGIRANTIAPGFIETPMANNVDAETKKMVTESVPMKRMGTAEEVADAALFLCSDAASYVTGSTIFVDGGFRAM
ncbi:hypothetical protein B0H16DRAFT_1549212 [Mycena metata]|uniref:Ketoreductase domain-containing protein n=1 Tax=Mycena metata TaxID=1033252 RepID=A0AAD7IUS6_9AGAR|nr:hypothetical protein B0H16DRAFT_1549212 [Mycena metata]